MLDAPEPLIFDPEAEHAKFTAELSGNRLEPTSSMSDSRPMRYSISFFDGQNGQIILLGKFFQVWRFAP